MNIYPFSPLANRLLVQLPSLLVMHLVSTTLATTLIMMWKKWYTGVILLSWACLILKLEI